MAPLLSSESGSHGLWRCLGPLRPKFCFRSAKSFLTGIEMESGKHNPVNGLTISGPGEAINVAVAAFMAMVGDNLATTIRGETSYTEITTNGAERG